MSGINENPNNFVGYEYKQIIVSREKASFYLDCHRNFGWISDENAVFFDAHNHTVNHLSHNKNIVNKTGIRLKRDRKIINKMELTRLQWNFEACANEINLLEKSKTSVATI